MGNKHGKIVAVGAISSEISPRSPLAHSAATTLSASCSSASSLPSQVVVQRLNCAFNPSNNRLRLTQAKKVNPDLASVNAQALQQVLKPLEQALERRQKLGADFLPHAGG